VAKSRSTAKASIVRIHWHALVYGQTYIKIHVHDLGETSFYTKRISKTHKPLFPTLSLERGQELARGSDLAHLRLGLAA
jgi:hypothetical protein